MATPKSKTNLACDRCRGRKQRCDGCRPSCSHCKAAGKECIYRPTPTNLETDNAVLSRLSDAEYRLQAVERRLDERETLSAPRPSDAQLLLRNSPDLHTAAACKMLRSWPRIRLCLTLPGVDPLTYLADADALDPLLLSPGLDDPEAPTLMLWQAAQLLETFYSNLAHLPVYINAIFELCPALGRATVLQALSDLHPSAERSSRDDVLHFRHLSLAQLLALFLACESCRESGLASRGTAAACFSAVLSQLWALHAVPEETRVPLSLAVAYSMVYFWARPFHALGLLQSLEASITRLSQRHADNRSLVHYYSRLYFILESDLLTEIDGFPSNTVLSLLEKTRPDYTADFVEMQSNEACVNSHFWLRSNLNIILELYTPNRAYAQPHELADLVCSLSAKLREWYGWRPRDQQFPRDATTFNMHVSSMPIRMREIALRYFACVFLLHRPVLYFYLHRDMEYTVRPPDTEHTQSGQEPWILESCRDCIESAALIVALCCGSPGNAIQPLFMAWFECQMLFAAYLVLLQVKSVASLTPIFRILGELDDMLDNVEMVFDALASESFQVKQSLAILRNERHNFAVSSPMQTA